MPRERQQFFRRYVDTRSLYEKAINLGGLSSKDVGRSFALVAGISFYPNAPITERNLAAAGEDLRKLTEYLEKYEFFDEIVVLQNEHVTTENLEFFLQSYFPVRLKAFPRSRFLFAYSGHGMTEGSASYLLKQSAHSLTDRGNTINLRVLKTFVDDVVDAGHHVLVLLNACYGSAFLARPFGPKTPPLPQYPGAHAITAGGSGERTWALPTIGSGSVFFEKVFAALDGRADDSGDGLITSFELASYLRNEVRVSTDQRQNPSFGDISRDGNSRGEFFFLDRRRQVAAGIVTEWRPEIARAFGAEARGALDRGKELYNAQAYKDAAAAFREAADRGSGDAMTWLGYLHEKGLGVPANDLEALKWYERAADAGDVTALHNLGMAYMEGRGVDKDAATAAAWFRRGAEAGDPAAMSKLGWVYRDGLGVAKDVAEALRWYKAGVNAGGAEAMAGLGYLYRRGIGVPADPASAISWFRKADELNDAWGASLLADVYLEGEGVPADLPTAIKYFRRSADLGSAWAMGRLGSFYRDGRGVPQDDVAAREWYRRAAERGDPDGMFYFAVFCREGRGGERNYAEAFRWFERAAGAGDSSAMSNLAWLYENGLGAARNMGEAMRFYSLAAAQGDKFAAGALERLKRQQ